jgi:hypothetical protein
MPLAATQFLTFVSIFMLSDSPGYEKKLPELLFVPTWVRYDKQLNLQLPIIYPQTLPIFGLPETSIFGLPVTSITSAHKCFIRA